MAKNSRAKGCRGERAARDYLVSLGFGDKSTTRRGQQHKGGGDSPDVICEALPGVHLEVKRVEGMDLGTQLLDDALDQAATECDPEKSWAVLWRPNNKPWRMTFNVGPPMPMVVTVCGDDRIRRALREMNAKYTIVGGSTDAPRIEGGARGAT